MKGGDVIMVHALAALHAAQALDRLRVTVVLTGDEEPARRSRRPAPSCWTRQARGRGARLRGRGGRAEHAVVARRGSTEWKLTVGGKPAHSSQIFQEDGRRRGLRGGAHPHRLPDTLAGEPNLTFNPGLLLGGTAAELAPELVRGTATGKGNVVAAQAW